MSNDIQIDVPDLKVIVDKQDNWRVILQEEPYRTIVQQPDKYLLSMTVPGATVIGLPLSAVFAISSSYAITGSYAQNGFPYSGSATITGNFTVANSASCVLFVTESGYVGVNMCDPQYALHVSGAIFATDDVTAFSDRRVKTDITPIYFALDRVAKLQGVTFTRLYDKTKTPHMGFIAQDVKEIVPEVVVGSEEDGYGIAYGNITALLVEAVKELKREINEIRYGDV